MTCIAITEQQPLQLEGFYRSDYFPKGYIPHRLEACATIGQPSAKYEQHPQFSVETMKLSQEITESYVLLLIVLISIHVGCLCNQKET